MILIKKYLPVAMVSIFTIALFYSIFKHIDGLGVLSISFGIMFFVFVMYNQQLIEKFRLGCDHCHDHDDDHHHHHEAEIHEHHALHKKTTSL